MTELIKQLKEKIDQADLVLVGIGEELEENFIELEKEYQSILEKTDKNENLIPFLKSDFLSKQVDNKNIRALKKLKELLQNKNYFVISLNKDGYIYKVGLDKERIVSPCGGYEYLQCVAHCNDNLVLAKEVVCEIMKQASNHEKIVYPVCENCGEQLCFNNVFANNYNEQGYMDQWQKYTKWLQGTVNKNLCLIELGVGLKYPTVVRWPFEKVVMYNLKASFFRIHENLYQLPDEIREKGVSVKENAVDFLLEL